MTGRRPIPPFKFKPLTRRSPRCGDDRTRSALDAPRQGRRRVKGSFHADSNPGFLVRWLSPGDYLAIAIAASDSKAKLYKRQDDGGLSRLALSATALSLTTNTWYEGKIVIDNDPGDSALQQLRFWVDADGDGDYSDETTLLTTTAVDDVWSAGYAGLYRYAGGSSAQLFDDVKIGYDNNADGDILDAGDDLQVDDDFGSSAMTLTYDNNGNLTDDGVLKFVYDAWNRLAKAKRRVDADTVIGQYRYLPDTRRASKVVSNCGVEHVPNDGGNTTVHFYYSSRWQILETRNGSSQTTFQYVWGTQYVDELVLLDKNGDPANTNDCDPDTTAQGETDQDRRYFAHQDRNWNVVALTEYNDGAGTTGRVAERYSYTPYGEFVVLKGDSGSGELGVNWDTSSIGAVHGHQGLLLDCERGTHQQRNRERYLDRFMTRDGPGYDDGLDLYCCTRSNPVNALDPLGLDTKAEIVDCEKQFANCKLTASLAHTLCYFWGAFDCAGKCRKEKDFDLCYYTCVIDTFLQCDQLFVDMNKFCFEQFKECMKAAGVEVGQPGPPNEPPPGGGSLIVPSRDVQTR